MPRVVPTFPARQRTPGAEGKDDAMTEPRSATRALPPHPSAEHLRKHAKRLAKERSLPLAEAQRRLALDYGFGNWAELLRAVAAIRGEAAPSLMPLAAAARADDLDGVRALLAQGPPDDGDQPLWQACAHGGENRLAIVDALLAAGANPRRDGQGETALHAAARRGPLALVERLIRGGALEWQTDRRHRSPADAARAGEAPDRDAILRLLQRPVIDDPSFRAAVAAIHAGDAAGLARLLDAEPRLLRERIVEPQCYRDASRHQYFLDPKLFWFVAGNPTLVPALPPNIVEIAEAMIARGVARVDLDYALELTMTSDVAERQGLQGPLIARLLEAGAQASPQAIETTLGHRLLGPVRLLLSGGQAMTAAIAAAFGDLSALAALLPVASPAERQAAFGLAVINGRQEAVRLTLDAGADVNAWLPVHRHSTALHQATLDENLALMGLLRERGARLDIGDRLWGGTPADWARHQGKARATAWFEAARNAPGHDEAGVQSESR